MVTVHSKSELRSAMDKKEKKIRIVGPYAKELYDKMQKKKKIKKASLITGGALIIGGILAAPFTGGASLAGTGAGLTMAGATIGTISLTTAELAIIVGAGSSIALYGIYKGSKMKFYINKKMGK